MLSPFTYESFAAVTDTWNSGVRNSETRNAFAATKVFCPWSEFTPTE